MTCTAQRPDGSFCVAPGIEDAPFPVCVKHAAALYEFLRSRVRDLEGDADRLVEAAHAVRERRRSVQPRATRARELIVYYVQVGALLKIGSTIDLPQRMNHYPPNRRLLAREWGTPALEGQRLAQFAEHRELGNEWFRPGPSLLAHVNDLRRRERASPVDPAAFVHVTGGTRQGA